LNVTIANEGREVCTNPLNLGLHQCQLLVKGRKIATHLLPIHFASFGAASSIDSQLRSLARRSTGTDHTERRRRSVRMTRSRRTKTELAERLRLNHWMSRGSGARHYCQ
jgi:hypothetical protein